MCCAGATDSSVNVSQHCKPVQLGFLCLLGSCFSAATTAFDAKYQGKAVSVAGNSLTPG
jgi:hypothetical protein